MLPEDVVGEDMIVALPLMLNTNKVLRLGESKYNYRIHNNSVTHSVFSLRRLKLFYAFEKQYISYKDNKIFEPYIGFRLYQSLLANL